MIEAAKYSIQRHGEKCHSEREEYRTQFKSTLSEVGLGTIV